MTPVLGIVLIVVATVALIAAGLALVGVRAVRRQRLVLQQARRNGTAYLCLPTHGQLRGAMATVAVDAREIRVVLQKAQPVTIASLPVAGSSVGAACVRINTAAVVDGLGVTAADGRDVLLALYPDPTLRHIKPLHGLQLVEAITVVSQAIDRESR